MIMKSDDDIHKGCDDHKEISDDNDDDDMIMMIVKVSVEDNVLPK